MKNLFFFMFLLFLVFFTCNSLDDYYTEDSDGQNETISTVLNDSDLELLTLVVQKALINSSDLRELLKAEVLLQRDGDYDFILVKAINGDILSNNTGTRSSLSIRA